MGLLPTSWRVQLLLPLLLCHVLADPTVTITSTDAYRRQRACVQACLWGFPAGGDLMTNLGCTSPWYETCLCRDDLAPAASSFISKCVNRDCATAPYDLNQAVSVYNGYCGRRQDQVATSTLDSPSTTILVITTVIASGGGRTVSTSQLSTGIIPTSVVVVTPDPTVTRYSTETIRPTPSDTLNSGSQPQRGLSGSDKIALGVGIGIGVPSLIVAAIGCLPNWHRRLRGQ